MELAFYDVSIQIHCVQVPCLLGEAVDVLLWGEQAPSLAVRGTTLMLLARAGCRGIDRGVPVNAGDDDHIGGYLSRETGVGAVAAKDEGDAGFPRGDHANHFGHEHNGGLLLFASHSLLLGFGVVGQLGVEARENGQRHESILE